MFAKFVLPATAAMFAALSIASPALADPRQCPPGHERKGWCEFGERNVTARDRDRDTVIDRGDRDLVIIRSLDDYALPPLPAGERYAVIDNRILRVSSDTYATIAVVGALSDLLR